MNAFRLELEKGYGIETDIRDRQGELVISHDMPCGGECSFSELLKIYKTIGNQTTLAINIKSDGLARTVKSTGTRWVSGGIVGKPSTTWWRSNAVKVLPRSKKLFHGIGNGRLVVVAVL